jgi:KUP system potassium uptake protein
VVYGDIGTSPLYAFKESLAAAAQGGHAEPAMVLGILSLILWVLFIIVTLKYVLLILRADNNGEGGILSLMTVAQRAMGARGWVLTLGMIGCALFYGDAIITPAISVLSAVEGFKLVAPYLGQYVLLMAMGILSVLFFIQRYGTEKIGRYFGPVMLLWFVCLAAGGISHILDSPLVWSAFNPLHAYYFITQHGSASLIALGTVFLAVTGAEALYADLGHFGKKPIRMAWSVIVMPALMLNYLGQAALVLAHPEAAENSFFLLYPDWALLPMVLLATAATIIASQAVITGAFSLTHQAIQLGILPRLRVCYTSAKTVGHIYLPLVNAILFLAVLLVVELFRTSSALASAYGIAVTGTMVITIILAMVVMRHAWRWSWLIVAMVAAPLFVIEVLFFGANLAKILPNGFLPVLLSAILLLVMRTWVRGSSFVHNQTFQRNIAMAELAKQVGGMHLHRVPGTAIYLSSNSEFAPSALLKNLTHNHVLHEHNIIFTLRFDDRPFVPEGERIKMVPLDSNFRRIFMDVGYMESPDVMAGLALLVNEPALKNKEQVTFFISRRNIVPSAKVGMPIWRDWIYISMANNASDVVDYFNLPLDRVVELGEQMTV